MLHFWLCIAIYFGTLAIMTLLGFAAMSTRRAEDDYLRAKPLSGHPSPSDTSADADDRVLTFPEAGDSAQSNRLTTAK